MTLLTSDTTPRAPDVWEPGHRFLLRAAGLPLETVRGLRCPDTGDWADEALELEERLTAEGAALSELLHGLLGAADAAGSEARRLLLRVRREVFNNRLPADPRAAERLVTGLSAPAGARLAHWLTHRARYAELLDRGPGLLAGEMRDARRALRAALAGDRLRLGLLLASPTLDSRLGGYLDDTGAEPGKRMRKIERSALTYLYRTACKTSPFSTLTAVATGTFDPGAAPSASLGPRLAEEWTSHVRLNVVVLGRLADLILADPVRRRDLPVVLAPGWGRDEDRIRYVRQWVTAGDDSAAVTFDAVRDRLFYLRGSGTLDRLLTFFSTHEGLRHRDLVDLLRTERGAGPDEAERYAAALLQLGMVQVPGLRTDVHSADPLRSFQQALRGLGAPWADAVAASLDGPAACLAAYPSAPLAERRALLGTLRAQLLDIQRELGAEEAALPQTLVYEDVSAGEDLPGGPGPLAGATGQALRRVEGILPMYDITLPQRITLKGFFLARHGNGGRCDDLLGLVHDFHEDFFDQYISFTSQRSAFDADGEYVPEENWLGQSALRTLDSARRRFVAGMREQWEKHGASNEIRLPAALLTEVAGELATIAPDFTPQSHHIQVAGDDADGRPLIVLNRSYGGLAFPFSRFTHVYDPDGSAPPDAPPGLSERLAGELLARAPQGTVLAELTGGPITTNLNLHGRLTSHQIVCPGETSTVPEDARIHLEDLYLRHDEATDRLVLRSRRLEREVVPVYLGYLVPVALPEIPRTLLLLSPSTMTPTDVWGSVPEGPARDGVTRRPRVVHDGVVVSRRSWTADARVLPARTPGADEAGWFLGWRRWRRAHGLPAQVFATVLREGRRALGAKPLYVDFDSPLSLTAFDALLERGPGDAVVLREMLPAEDAPHAVSAQGHHVAELAVETFTSRPRTEDGPTCRN
ncbi:lantibiotic dehydratase [Streptomyces sp. AC1-42W]|uniref:lantibiotic dehydratase n=1 Tax=Streptomyces sp. AC1-42W TaxID=2218666 RepID=UPI000DAE648A|nr:lantibiotic dehydratase [Streptomyces sp. AC1-42W]PZT75509.1 lantibiotic dehydratase [Streptomyces sp. AC1-42W]